MSQKFVDGYDDRNANGQLDVGEAVNFRIRAKNAGTHGAECQAAGAQTWSGEFFRITQPEGGDYKWQRKQ